MISSVLISYKPSTDWAVSWIVHVTSICYPRTAPETAVNQLKPAPCSSLGKFGGDETPCAGASWFLRNSLPPELDAKTSRSL